ncbi:hypothetical protein MHYP_G00052230 [Metynnis hypsauchen]
MKRFSAGVQSPSGIWQQEAAAPPSRNGTYWHVGVAPATDNWLHVDRQDPAALLYSVHSQPAIYLFAPTALLRATYCLSVHFIRPSLYPHPIFCLSVHLYVAQGRTALSES